MIAGFDTQTLVTLIGVAVASGIAGGVLAGLLGVGGGIVIVPALYFALTRAGFAGPATMQLAVGTSLATIVFTAISSSLGHYRRGAIDMALLKLWAPSILLGVLAGSLLAGHVSSNVLVAVFATVAALVAVDMVFRRPAESPEPGSFSKPVWAVLGFLAGGISAMMGIGGGTFGVPLMTLFNMPIHRAVGTASGFGVLIAVPSVIGFLMLHVANAPPWTVGAVNLPAFLIVIGSTLLTTPWGVWLAHEMDPKPLKRAFAIFLVLVSLNMLRKVVGW